MTVGTESRPSPRTTATGTSDRAYHLVQVDSPTSTPAAPFQARASGERGSEMRRRRVERMAMPYAATAASSPTVTPSRGDGRPFKPLRMKTGLIPQHIAVPRPNSDDFHG